MPANVLLLPPRPSSPWRRISLGSWRPTGDSSIYAAVELRMEPIEQMCTELLATGTKASPTHALGVVIARALADEPAANALVRFGRVHPRQHVDLFFHVAPTDAGDDDLSGVVIRQANELDVRAFAAQFRDQLSLVRAKQDKAYRTTKKWFRFVPGWMSKWVLDASAFVSYSLNVWWPWLGMPRDAFGSIMVTNVGSLGVEQCFVPLAPYTRIPMVISIGAVRSAALVVDGVVVVARVCSLGLTFDHRLMDGVHGAAFVAALKRHAANPQALLIAPSASLASTPAR
jgi:pyruvate/2-oxoglutarate dehydrogenase complex dihydrolipoamide acyltransferase (E2) component